MDQLFDQVRDRTADLRRVAEAVRRERDLRAPASTAAATGSPIAPLATAAPVSAMPAAMPPTTTACDAGCAPGTASRAA